jgi:hypothetical protein
LCFAAPSLHVFSRLSAQADQMMDQCLVMLATHVMKEQHLDAVKKRVVAFGIITVLLAITPWTLHAISQLRRK